MNEFQTILTAFHFIRPLWLLALPVIAALWWIVRAARTRRGMALDGIAPHLREALTVEGQSRRRLQPIDGVAACLALVALGTAGPTWSRVPDPFAAQSAPVVVVLKVTSSMERKDIAPSRLERGKQKIRDLLQLRAGARTALVAYAGSAHGVVPMTDDPGVMTPYLEGLSTDVMPKQGEVAAEALALAQALLARETVPGGVLIVADAIDPSDVAPLNAAGISLAVLSMLPEGTRDRGMDQLSAPLVTVTPDATDIRQLDRTLDAAWRQAMLENGDQPWQDRGHWLAWPAALLVLAWFRRGWTMRWAAIAALAVGLWAPQPARADGLVDYFLTQDQQGRLAFDRKDFDRAADLFVDPLWRGYALYRDGQYAAAIEVLDRVETAQAAFIQGMAGIKAQTYRAGVQGFETALARDPNYPHAADNLAVARRIVEYVEQVSEQSDTGDSAESGADKDVYDNDADRGQETEVPVSRDGKAKVLLTTEQWMNTVDTRPADFLRQRFALEAARGTTPTSETGPAPAENGASR